MFICKIAVIYSKNMHTTDIHTCIYFFYNCRFLKFSESSYKARAHIRSLEEQGRRGDRILVRGIRTGSALVSAKLTDPAYKVHTEICTNPVAIDTHCEENLFDV